MPGQPPRRFANPHDRARSGAPPVPAGVNAPQPGGALQRRPALAPQAAQPMRRPAPPPVPAGVNAPQPGGALQRQPAVASPTAQPMRRPAPPPMPAGMNAPQSTKASPARAEAPGPCRISRQPPAPGGAVAQAKAVPVRCELRVPPRRTGIVQSATNSENTIGSISELLATIAADRATFQPQGANNPTQANFEALRNAGRIAVNDLMAIIPAGADDEWESFPGRTQRGFKFAWRAGAVDWVVWGHEPDLGAAPGHAGAAGWTVRIRRGNQYLMDTTINPPVGAAYDWALGNTPAKIQHSHIPLDGVA
jgi:hypothetical protein